MAGINPKDGTPIRNKNKAGHNPGYAKHPYAATEHRVIDSPAYADLGFGARALLVLLTRQLSKDNNGNLQASYAYCKRYGFGSEHTLRNALAELIGHGFVYRTRSHGNAPGKAKSWARYAVTWLTIKNRDNLFLDGYLTCSWRDWKPTEKKSPRQKVLDTSGRKCSFTPEHPAESAGNRPAETAVYELMPCSTAVSPSLGTTATVSTTGTTDPWSKFRSAIRFNIRPGAKVLPFTVAIKPGDPVEYPSLAEVAA